MGCGGLLRGPFGSLPLTERALLVRPGELRHELRQQVRDRASALGAMSNVWIGVVRDEFRTTAADSQSTCDLFVSAGRHASLRVFNGCPRKVCEPCMQRRKLRHPCAILFPVRRTSNESTSRACHRQIIEIAVCCHTAEIVAVALEKSQSVGGEEPTGQDIDDQLAQSSETEFCRNTV